MLTLLTLKRIIFSFFPQRDTQPPKEQWSIKAGLEQFDMQCFCVLWFFLEEEKPSKGSCKYPVTPRQRNCDWWALLTKAFGACLQWQPSAKKPRNFKPHRPHPPNEVFSTATPPHWKLGKDGLGAGQGCHQHRPAIMRELQPGWVPCKPSPVFSKCKSFSSRHQFKVLFRSYSWTELKRGPRWPLHKHVQF